MNCADVEPFLEQLGHDSVGHRIPNESNVRQHLAHCPSCQQSLRMIERWDRQLSRAMVNIAVPDGLAARLETTLKAQSADAQITTSRKARTSLMSRNRLKMAAAACLFLISSWWVNSRWDSAQLSATNITLLWEMQPEAISTKSHLTQKLPHGWSSIGNIVSHDWQQITLKAPPLTLVAKSFDLRYQRGEVESLWLYVIPKSRWSSVPLAPTHLTNARVQYSSDRVWIVWAEEDYIFILAKTGTPESLERLQLELGGHHAVF